MDTFGILGFVFGIMGMMGFVFAMSLMGQVSELKKDVEKLKLRLGRLEKRSMEGEGDSDASD